MIPAKEIDGELWIRAADARIQEAAKLRLQMDLRMSLDAMKQALEALEECIGYKTSPFMERECEAAITALRAAIEQAQDPETELETYKRLYELRGKALERACSNCGHQPAKIKAMAQPEQEPVAWMWADGTVTADPDRADGTWTPLYTSPRQWQGLTEQEIKDCEKQAMVNGSLPFEQRSFFARAIEARLKEKNA